MTRFTNAGRRGRTWEAIKANQRAKRLPCFRCGQPIDYELHFPDPGSFSAGHIISKRDRPDLAEDPTNVCSEHLRCNQGGGTTVAAPTSNGTASEEW
jgi:hypothetical protein